MTSETIKRVSNTKIIMRINGDSKKSLTKLVVLLPAFNEEELIGKTIEQIPRKILGIDKV